MDVTFITEPMTVRLFIKPWCSWCRQTEDWLRAREIAYEVLDVSADPKAAREMAALSGQTLAPVIEVNGRVLADFDTGQLEVFWKQFK
jgi:glutaredoxin